MNDHHIPVMALEVLEALKIRGEKLYIDCNLGFGGHTSLILQTGGSVIGFDTDLAAVKHCNSFFAEQVKNGKLVIINDNFRNLDKHIKTKVDGILYDLGMSTHQIKEQNKGFSYEDDSELDMRMDANLGVTAHQLIKALNVKQLEKIILDFGEDPQAKRFAIAIKNLYQKSQTDPSAKEVAEEIRKASKYKASKIHPATRTFQALRIAVNSELENLRESLGKATQLLKPEGRLAIISFHSLEDEISKSLAESPELVTVTKKPITASKEEIASNPASRSAKLRIYEKI